jgi:hypothetical protein
MTTHNPGEQKRYPKTDENHLRYLLYLPPKFNERPEQRWPVLCFLHGAGEAAKDKAGQDQPVEVLFYHGTPPWHCEIRSPLIQDFIVLSPQLPVRGPWARQDYEKVVQILGRIYDDFRGDPARTYLTGFSYGGRGVFDFASWADETSPASPAQKVTWAALWPIDDANDQARMSCPVKRVWLHFGTWKPGPQLSTVANLKLTQAGTFRNGTPKAEGLYTDYTPLDYDHVITCVAAYADWRVYQWLLHPG